MKQTPKTPELKLPCFKGVAPQLRSPELDMDDYYKAVVMVRQSMPCQPELSNGGSERFVIRDEDETWPAKGPK